MTVNGQISGVEHFDSMCYNYSGNSIDGKVRWTSVNDCLLAPEGLEITSSANGRDESDNLVLRFTATVTFSEEFFSFKNKTYDCDCTDGAERDGFVCADWEYVCAGGAGVRCE